MQRHTLLNHHKTSLSPRKISVNPSFSDKNHGGFWLVRSVTPPIILNISFNNNHISKLQSVVFDGNQGYQLDNEEDDELCPIECVREFKTDDDFLKILEKGKDNGSLVVVDFYRTSCGSCKYIEQGFSKLCKGSGSREAPIIFLKHNVINEYDEQSEVAERLRIKENLLGDRIAPKITLKIKIQRRAVPLFHFYRDGVLLESFPTRDKERILAAILKYTSLTPDNI